MATLNREDIRSNLPRDVRLLLSKARSAESMQINQQVKSTILEYYGLPKLLQKKVRSTYVAILKDLEVPDADEKLHEPTDAEIAQESSEGGQPPGPPPSPVTAPSSPSLRVVASPH